MRRRVVAVVISGALSVLAPACVADGDIEGAIVPAQTPEADDSRDDAGSELAAPEAIAGDCPPVAVPDGVALPVDPTDGVSCGFVVLPEDRTDAAGPVVEVAYTRLDARPPPGIAAFDNPLIVLADGPGQPMTTELVGWLDSSIRTARDVILLDSRGAGRSFPLLDCGVTPALGALPLDLVQDCHRELQADGVRLDHYTTAAMAADVVDVAGALGLEAFSVLGIGHGGRVALEVLRDGPEGLQSVVVDSPLPPEVDVYATLPTTAQSALNRLFDECAQTPACAAQFSDLRVLTEDAILRRDVIAGASEDQSVVSGSDLVRALLAALRGADGPAAVPAAVSLVADDEVEEGMARLLAAAAAPTSMTGFAEGVLLSSDCHDEVPFADDGPDVADMGPVGAAVVGQVEALRQACAIWDVPADPGPATSPVTSDVPVLVLTGEFDPTSPAAWGAAVAARMPRGQVVQVDGAGHRVHDVDNCTVALVVEFLRRPLRTLNDACARDRIVDFVLS